MYKKSASIASGLKLVCADNLCTFYQTGQGFGLVSPFFLLLSLSTNFVTKLEMVLPFLILFAIDRVANGGVVVEVSKKGTKSCFERVGPSILCS